MQELKCGKSDECSCLMSDHVINTSDDLFIHISLLLTCLLVHGTVSDGLLESTIYIFSKEKLLIVLRPLIIVPSP